MRQDLSVGTNNFDLVTLTFEFDLLFKNLNHENNFWTVSPRAFIFHMSISCDKTNIFDPVTLTLEFNIL